jgi:hypothetical protein
MTAPKSSTYRGWHYDPENTELDLYAGFGGASDPAQVFSVKTSATDTSTGLPTLNMKGRFTETFTVVDDNSQNMTLAVADILAGINVHTSTSGGGTVTVDTAANIIAGIPLTADNQSVTSYYINDGSQTVTFAVATGTSIADTGSTILTNEAAVLLWRRTSSTTVTLYIMH